MEKNACGIVSYAGLSKETLLSLGKAAFAQAQPPVPKRFDAFLPLFPIELVQNMEYVGMSEAKGARVAPSGFSIDPVEYHRKLYLQFPELYTGDNYARNFDYEGRYVGRGVFTVDQAWVDHFPQYQPFMSEKLMIYLIGGGFQAVAVPESVYPRGGGVLEAAESTMQITQRVELFNHYARARIATGDKYDAELFHAGFLNTTGLTVTTLTQKEIGRVLQDMSIIKSLQSDTASVGLYTENARRAERVSQYVPMRYACDLFTPEAVDKHTARLAQLYNADSDYVSDLWIPYQDFTAYVDKRTMTLDVRRLCEGYQIAPRYDPDTFGGLYPDAVRVVVVRDRDLKLMVGDVINNPAYGDGMGPQGMIGKQVYIADSREMIRQRKLVLEEVEVAADNVTLPPSQYRRSLALAVLQEHKGRLVDAMYRRETALEQINPDTPVYAKACTLLSERVEKLNALVKRESAQSGMSQMSGYDADIDYLRRKELERAPEETTGTKRIAFARDAQREQSIESGYAMRTGLLRMMYQDAALPEPPPEQTVGADDSEDEANREHLPPIPANAVREMPAGVQPEAEAAGDDEVTLDDRHAAKAKGGLVKEKPIKASTAEAAMFHAEKNAANTHLQGGEEAATESTSPASKDKAAEPYAAIVETGSASEQATNTDAFARPVQDKETSDPDEHQDAVASVIETSSANGKAISVEPTGDVQSTHTDGAGETAEPDNKGEKNMSEGETDTAEPGTGKSIDANAESEPATDRTVDTACPAARAASHKRVSLRELTDRHIIEPEPPLPETPAEPEKEEPPKPKLAFILRRGSEDTASKSYSRMSELLRKREE